MGADATEPPPAGAEAALDGEARRAGPPERYGPLEVHRFVKRDGRALILYERVEAEEPR
jgi:hypothetical protein